MAAHHFRLRRHRRDTQRGAILIHVAVMLIALIAFLAFIVDYGLMWVGRRQAQNAADAGAMAGAIALAFDNFSDRTDTGPAKVAAHNFALSNLVLAQAPDVNVTTDITFPACPDDGSNTCIRVDVYRNQARGNALPIWFGQLIGLTDQGVRATATAQALGGNASDCLKPFAIPDKWYDNHDESPPIDGIWTEDDFFEKTYQSGSQKGNPVPNPDVYVPPTNNGVPQDPNSGFKATPQSEGGDLGRLLTLKAPGPQDALAPGFFFPVRLPLPGGEVSTGGDDYRENIANCNGVPVAIEDYLENEPGNMVGPTAQGMQDLYNLDPGATFNTTTNSIENSCAQWANPCAPKSPRLVAVPVFDTEVYYAGKQNGLVTLKIANILGFFINQIQGNEVSGYFMTIPGLLLEDGPTLPPNNAFLTSVVLVR